ncbi:MAG: hydrogenase formation protein HypD [Heliobacteriaceae bacterium]|nr:hydrogenase formation protein HypD [Heliobacteriaceae bacterium]MDD4587041.1 hydrogenase formation protein HypD [Heliobacteriaceae bacterium]
MTFLRDYAGPPVKIMEVCGTHTASIFKNGIRSLISPQIKLISGPGCPVCVTPAAYIDAAVDVAQQEQVVLLTFGDMVKVPGTKGSLGEAKAAGAAIKVIYSPLQALELAARKPETLFVVAAVGFETTVPVYALLLAKCIEAGLTNVKLLTALKTVMPALAWICRSEPDIDGFLCPGHVSVITGATAYRPLAANYGKPFVIAGFGAEHILAAVYEIVKLIRADQPLLRNLYTNVVREEGNPVAQELIARYFTPAAAHWRGIGEIGASGLVLKDEFRHYDVPYAPGNCLATDAPGCACGQVITGRIDPAECPLFGQVCTPSRPQGPCMVSAEGACGIWFRNR